MKITFQFDTESEGFDAHELECYVQANKTAYCLYRITNQIREWYKWDERNSIPADEIHEKLWDIIQEEVNMEKLGY